MRARISSKGWVVIPKQIREKYGLKPGQEVEIIDYAGSVSIVPVPDDPIAALYGMFAERGGKPLTQELLEEHRRELEREERRAAR